jgi:hypothetical protein
MSFDLLDAILPAEGRYCVIGISSYPDQRFADTREEVSEIAKQFVARQNDAYFACAKFGPLPNRTQENALYFRALWMDIDCGPTKGVPDEEGRIKGYLSQELGLQALQQFCKAVGLPRPVLVNSGNGIHAYWLLEEVLSRRQWEPLSKRLRDLCVEHNLIVDPSVFEASRVLRIPGTYNFKNKAEPLEVTVLSDTSPRMNFEYVKNLLGAPEPEEETPDFIPRGMSPMMEAMMANKVKRFKTIMLRSANNDGCAQLLYCYENQTTLEEPLWRAALSITAFCVDKDAAAHRMSNQYPGYDPVEVDKKLNYIVDKGGPYTCATFEKLRPGGCDECPHKDKIKSPILLGVEIAEADDGEVVVQTEEGESKTYEIPEYPFPYFRGKNGGVYKKPTDDEEEPALVYEHDLYVVKRMTHAELGEVVLMRLHLPRDGVKEFSVPMTAVVVKEKLRESLAHHGVIPTPKQMDHILYYVTASIKNLQFSKKAEIMRTQFGWIEKDSKFILGDREITKDGAFYSPPSNVTKAVVENIHPAGTFEKWKEVFNMYSAPGLEPHAFAALTAFGSPLLKFTGLSGAIINVIYPRSGSGKSTTLYMCNSVVGHPVKLASIWKDTINSKMHMLGVMNNLANTIDEITNTSPLEFSDLAYSISQGRGKNRMKSQSNEMRVNNTSWQGITLTSSNASFYEKLGAAKDSPDGEMMRLLEYKIEPNDVIDVAVGKAMFDHQLHENYGHAGEVYAQWLVNNLEDALDLLFKVQARIDKAVQFTSRERFWSGVAACNIAGGLISKNLGLHDYDMRRVYEWLVHMLAEMREDVKPPAVTPIAILGDYLNSHIGNALVVNGENDARSSLVPMPTLEPRGELLIRYEPDTKDLYIAAGNFKDFCVKRQINYKETLKELNKLGAFIEGMNKRMGKGMKIVSPAVRALRFNAEHFDFIQVDNLIKHEDRDDNVPT